MRVILQFGLVMLLSTGAGASAQDRVSFTVGTATAARGQKAFGAIQVPAGIDPSLAIPVAVVHGAKPGPVLAIVSGAHGTEYASIIAVERLIQQIDASAVSGTVILVPLVNVPSFEQKTAHVNPVDGKSMNRFYPGRMDGTQTERASFLITKQVVEPADHLIDLHGGDLDESLRPYSYWTKTGNEKQDATSREMLLAFGLDHIIISADRPKDAAASRYLKMLPGAPSFVESPVWIERIASITSEATGIFNAQVARGTYVQKGMKVGTVTDYVGRVLIEAHAPESGVVLFIRAVPSTTKGETIANIGVPVK
jgi:uncharacterized protein